MPDVLTPEQRRKNMQHIRGKDTKIEIILRKALWKEDTDTGNIINQSQVLRYCPYQI